MYGIPEAEKSTGLVLRVCPSNNHSQPQYVKSMLLCFSCSPAEALSHWYRILPSHHCNDFWCEVSITVQREQGKITLSTPVLGFCRYSETYATPGFGASYCVTPKILPPTWRMDEKSGLFEIISEEAPYNTVISQFAQETSKT